VYSISPAKGNQSGGLERYVAFVGCVDREEVDMRTPKWLIGTIRTFSQG